MRAHALCARHSCGAGMHTYVGLTRVRMRGNWWVDRWVGVPADMAPNLLVPRTHTLTNPLVTPTSGAANQRKKDSTDSTAQPPPPHPPKHTTK